MHILLVAPLQITYTPNALINGMSPYSYYCLELLSLLLGAGCCGFGQGHGGGTAARHASVLVRLDANQRLEEAHYIYICIRNDV